MKGRMLNLFKENQVRAAARATIQGTKDVTEVQAAISIVEGKLELFKERMYSTEDTAKKKVYAIRIARLNNELYRLNLDLI